MLETSNINFELYLIRHGQSDVNTRPDEMGQRPDVPLTRLGERQALALEYRFQEEGIVFDKVYASPHKRAFDTAKIASGFDESKIILVSELIEYDAGEWIGKSRKATITDDIKIEMGFLNSSFRPPSGESLHMVERRASQWLDYELLYNESFKELCSTVKQPVIIGVFTHGQVIKSLLHYVMGFDNSFTWKIDIDNTSITKLTFGHNGWRLNCINDYSHLR